MQSAQKSWIRLRGFHHLDNVIKGVKFVNGKIDINNEGLLITGSQDKVAA